MKQENKKFDKKLALKIIWIHITIIIFFLIRSVIHPIYFFVAITFLIGMIPYIIAYRKDHFIAYEPIYLFTTAIIFTHTFVLFFSPTPFNYNFSEDLMIKFFVIFDTSLLLLIAGYYLFNIRNITKKIPSNIFSVNEMYLKKMLVGLYLSGWIIRLIIYPTSLANWGLFHFLNRTLIYLAMFLDFHFFLKTKEKKHLIRILILFILEIIFFGFFKFAMVENIVFPVFLLILLFIKEIKKIPLSNIFIFLIMVIFIINPVVKTFRTMYDQEDPIRTVVETFRKLADKNYNLDLQKGIIDRMSSTLIMSVRSLELKSANQEIKFFSGNLLAYLVPRVVWPNKPSINQNDVGYQLGMIGKNNYNTAISPTLTGGLFLAHHIFLAPIYYLIIGIILQIYWQYFMINYNESIFTTFIYFMLIYSWMRTQVFEQIIISNISLVVYMILFVLIIKFLIRSNMFRQKAV